MSAMGNFVIDVGERVAAALNIPPEWGDELLTRYADRADEAMAAAVADGVLDVDALAQVAADEVVEAFHQEAHESFGSLSRLAS